MQDLIPHLFLRFICHLYTIEFGEMSRWIVAQDDRAIRYCRFHKSVQRKC